MRGRLGQRLTVRARMLYVAAGCAAVLLFATGLGGSSGSSPSIQTFNTDLNRCLESYIPSFQRMELPPARLSNSGYTFLWSGDPQSGAVFVTCWDKFGPVYDGTSGEPGS